LAIVWVEKLNLYRNFTRFLNKDNVLGGFDRKYSGFILSFLWSLPGVGGASRVAVTSNRALKVEKLVGGKNILNEKKIFYSLSKV
jgi:hypothetical protein